MTRVVSRERVISIGRAAVRDPYEAMQRVLERGSEWNDGRGQPEQLSVRSDWERLFHEQLGQPWPCSAQQDFASMFEDLVVSLAATGLQVGRGAYGGWDDGDAALARAAWCATLHTKPRDVVETGVARGISSRFVLEALERNGSGRLWSIDVPPLLEIGLRDETGLAIPAHLRPRWRYLEGSSRKRLPVLLDVLQHVDVFIHDSMHTTRNVAFELTSVWRYMRPGGVMIIDDIQRNSGFARFASAEGEGIFVAGSADDGRATIGVAIKTDGIPPNAELPG
jgi:hypothetical protein